MERIIKMDKTYVIVRDGVAVIDKTGKLFNTKAGDILEVVEKSVYWKNGLTRIPIDMTTEHLKDLCFLGEINEKEKE